jgi:hypothetical protein
MSAVATDNITLDGGSRLDGGDFAGWDGRSSTDHAARFGWTALVVWGQDGWEFGSWPYVIYFVRHHSAGMSLDDDIPFLPARPFELCQYVEGDLTVWAFSSAAERQATIDQLAVRQWVSDHEAWAKGANPENPPARLCGPYRGA